MGFEKNRHLKGGDRSHSPLPKRMAKAGIVTQTPVADKGTRAQAATWFFIRVFSPVSHRLGHKTKPPSTSGCLPALQEWGHVDNTSSLLETLIFCILFIDSI